MERFSLGNFIEALIFMVLNSGDIFLKGGFSCETILPHLKCLLSKWFHPSTLRVSELFHQKLSFFWGGKYQRTFYIISFLCCFSTYDMSEGESGTSLYLIICILYLIYWKRHHNLHHRRADFVFFPNAVLHEITFSMTIGHFRCVQHF